MQRLAFSSILSLGAGLAASSAYAEMILDNYQTPFNTGSVTANSTDPWFGVGWVGTSSNPGSGPFNTRAVGISGIGSQASGANGSMSVSLSPGNPSVAAGTLGMYYFNSSDGFAIDRSRTFDLGWVPGNPLPKWRVHLGSYSGQLTDWQIDLVSDSTSEPGQDARAFCRVVSVTSEGWLTFDLDDPTPGRAYVQTGFDFSNVHLIGLSVTPKGLSQTGASFSIDSFTLVPAPGAIVLLGAAGLLGRRRRA
jgi:hypothetical protein